MSSRVGMRAAEILWPGDDKRMQQLIARLAGDREQNAHVKEAWERLAKGVTAALVLGIAGSLTPTPLDRVPLQGADNDIYYVKSRRLLRRLIEWIRRLLDPKYPGPELAPVYVLPRRTLAKRDTVRRFALANAA